MINKAGFDLITEFEGFSAEPYQDQKGVWSIGYGQTGNNIGPNTPPVTPEQAMQTLKYTLADTEYVVRELLASHTTDNQLAAMVSFSYNLGTDALRNSTLLQLHNNEQYGQAAQEFPKWDHIRINGVLTESPGLLRRRQAEQSLYLTASTVLI